MTIRGETEKFKINRFIKIVRRGPSHRRVLAPAAALAVALEAPALAAAPTLIEQRKEEERPLTKDYGSKKSKQKEGNAELKTKTGKTSQYMKNFS